MKATGLGDDDLFKQDGGSNHLSGKTSSFRENPSLTFKALYIL